MLAIPTIRLFSLATGLLVSVVVALLTLGGIAHAQPVPPHVVVGQVFDNQQLLGSGTVRAYLGEQLVGTGTVERGAYKVVVEQSQGGDYSGQTMRFTVDSQGQEYKTSAQVKWEVGGGTVLELRIKVQLQEKLPQVERQPEIQSEDLEAFESRRLKEIEEEEHSGEIHIENEKAKMAQELEGARDRLNQQIEQQKLQMDQELDELRDLIKLEQENDAYLIGRREELSRQQAQLDQVIEECGNQGEACSVLFGGSYETESSIESGMLTTRMNLSDRERQLEQDLLGRTRNMMDDHSGRLAGFRLERDNTLERMQEDHRHLTNTLHRHHQDKILGMEELLINELQMRREEMMRKEQMEREAEMREKEGEERREMEREQMEAEEEMRREQMKLQAERQEREGKERMEMERQRMEQEDEMRRELMELERQQMQSGQPGVRPVGDESPQSGPSRGLFSNKKAGEATSGIDNIMDAGTLTIIGIVLTVLTTGMTLFKGD